MSEPAVTIQAYHVSQGSNLPITRVVIHDEEYPVSNHSAEDIARYFAGSGSGGSAQYVVDADSEQHCVAEKAIAWHAPPNPGSIGIEMDGYSRFTSADWQTPGSQGSLRRAAARTADLCQRYNLPVVWLTPADLLAGKHGITSHMNVSAAWHQSDHTDPGLQFPINQFLDMVHEAMGQTPPSRQEINVEGTMFAANPAGPGGWEVAADGGVFTVAPAGFFGSMGGKTMNAPVVALVPTPTGMGYALVGKDGGIFNFGDAHWQAYAPFTAEYQQGIHHVIGAGLTHDGHLVYVSNKLETYVL